MPLFSSYVFVKTNKSEFLEVLKAPGVVRFVSFDGVPVEIPEYQIEKIKWILSSDIVSEVIVEEIAKGSIVEIIKGPLMGLKAEMANYKNKSRILVRLEQLDKLLEIDVPISHVKII